MGYKVVRGSEEVACHALCRGGVEAAQRVCERSVESRSQTRRRMRLEEHLAVKNAASRIDHLDRAATRRAGHARAPAAILLQVGTAAAAAPSRRSRRHCCLHLAPVQCRLEEVEALADAEVGNGRDGADGNLSAMKRMTSIDVRLRWTRR